MPPFTFNLCQNGNFFGSFHFGVSSCRHFVDSLRPDAFGVRPQSLSGFMGRPVQAASKKPARPAGPGRSREAPGRAGLSPSPAAPPAPAGRERGQSLPASADSASRSRAAAGRAGRCTQKAPRAAGYNSERVGEFVQSANSPTLFLNLCFLLSGGASPSPAAKTECGALVQGTA